MPYARNPRLHSPDQVAQLEASIREFGWTIPILLDEDGGIIAGHGRVMAAKGLGFTEAPCMVARGWTDAKKRAYVIADNKLTLNASWDEALLRSELEFLKESDFDLELTGFGLEEVNFIFGDDGYSKDPDDAPDVPENPSTEFGDVWLLGMHRIVCGDSTDAATVAVALGGAKPNLMVTDPPYGVGFERGKFVGREKAAKGKKFPIIVNDDLRGEALADFVSRIMLAWGVSDGAAAYLWSAALAEGYSIFKGISKAGFRVQSQIVWNKTPFVIGRADYHWKHEICWYAFKGKGHAWYGGRDKGTVWDIPKAKTMTDHPTTKPVECMKRPIENNSKRGDAVYEPFAGSGTTIIAGEMTGRTVYAIELSPAYVDVSVLRWQEFTGKKATHEKTGRTFDEVAAGRKAKAA